MAEAIGLAIISVALPAEIAVAAAPFATIIGTAAIVGQTNSCAIAIDIRENINDSDQRDPASNRRVSDDRRSLLE